jgi:hypothetical protein
MFQQELIDRYIETDKPDIKPILSSKPEPHSAPRDLRSSSFPQPSPGPPVINTFPKYVTGVKPVIDNRAGPIPPVEVTDGLIAVLLAYSQAIMNLNINYRPDQAQALAKAISSAKIAVISYHENTIKDLQMDVTVKDEQVRQLLDEIEEQEEKFIAMQSELRQEVLKERAEKERYKRAWDESAEMRKEYEEMKEERDRKIQEAVKIWETTEKAQLRR